VNFNICPHIQYASIPRKVVQQCFSHVDSGHLELIPNEYRNCVESIAKEYGIFKNAIFFGNFHRGYKMLYSRYGFRANQELEALLIFDFFNGQGK
jgi:hypothetical protein